MSVRDERDDCARCGTVAVLDGGYCAACVVEIEAAVEAYVATAQRPTGSYRSCTLCGVEYVGTCELCARCNNWTITGKDIRP